MAKKKTKGKKRKQGIKQRDLDLGVGDEENHNRALYKTSKEETQ